MTLTPNQLKDICLLNHSDRSKTCRYLHQDELDESKWYCQKLRPDTKAKIDKNLEPLRDRAAVNVPMGDNCFGYPLLKHIDQGYDAD